MNLWTKPGLPDGIFLYQTSQFEYIFEGNLMENVSIFYCHLVHLISWYNFPALVCCTKKMWQSWAQLLPLFCKETYYVYVGIHIKENFSVLKLTSRPLTNAWQVFPYVTICPWLWSSLSEGSANFETSGTTAFCKPYVMTARHLADRTMDPTMTLPDEHFRFFLLSFRTN
jgi:hypothetical protein